MCRICPGIQLGSTVLEAIVGEGDNARLRRLRDVHGGVLE